MQQHFICGDRATHLPASLHSCHLTQRILQTFSKALTPPLQTPASCCSYLRPDQNVCRGPLQSSAFWNTARLTSCECLSFGNQCFRPTGIDQLDQLSNASLIHMQRNSGIRAISSPLRSNSSCSSLTERTRTAVRTEGICGTWRPSIHLVLDGVRLRRLLMTVLFTALHLDYKRKCLWLGGYLSRP